jgi:hypothetical protein
MKLIHDFLPTNDNVSRWKSINVETCPSCPHPKEDRDHVLRCPIPLARNGVGCFLSLFEKPVTNYLPDPIFK